ncbi:MAG TPA: VOC family protein [Candidatus Limiplasma sp.]|nr:VOC family protein [Candidatus Limiplasma sp.]HPS80737.1 VOC family protein [Candidatus Limiplasma sp.]
MILGIDHVTINVTDLAGTLRFYGDVLGLSPLPGVDMGDHELRYFTLPGGAKLELVTYRYPTEDRGQNATDRGRARHLAFEVEDAYATEKKLTEAGYPFHVPVSYVTKLGFYGGLTRDPNGFEVEFLQYPKK